MLQYLFIYLLSFLLILDPLSAGEESQKQFFILRCRAFAGMFSIFDDVAYMLKQYDQGKLGGLEINFGTSPPYYEHSYGPNWWQYYCEPIYFGDPNSLQIRDLANQYYASADNIEFHTSKDRVHELIKKYIHLRPHIADKVDDFVAKQFKGSFVFGVHYRGTDKVSEAPRVEYEKVAEAIKKAAQERRLKEYKIYVATDEQAFLDFMITKYRHRILALPDAIRSKSNQPVHLNAHKNQYIIGENAIMDCVLLSKTHLLIRTSSNLSRWSTYFNPSVPVIELSRRR